MTCLEADAVFAEDHVIGAVAVPGSAVFFPFQQIHNISFALSTITGDFAAYNHTACKDTLFISVQRQLQCLTCLKPLREV